MRILVTEDEKDLADALAKGLERQGYAVDVAYDGEESLRLAEVNEYDLLILDLNLPKVDGMDISRMRGGGEVKYRLSKVGFVFQSYYLIPNMTALENVMLPMELNGTKRKDRLTKARELLKRVGINDALHARRPSRLSGGEQQRVAIARALANDPSIILGDEPTGNLDSKTGKRIVEILYSLTKEGRTVIVATHATEIATRADMVLEMEDGKVTIASVFESAKR